MKMKIISTSWFKSNSGKTKTYVSVLENGTIGIVQKHLIDKFPEQNCELLRKYKDKYLVFKQMAFKMGSFATVLEIVNKCMPQIDTSKIE